MYAIKEKLANVHFENQMWHKELAFYKSEIDAYLERLKELLATEEEDRLLTEFAKFQTEFLHKSETLENLIHFIDFQEIKIMEMTKMNGSLKEITDSGHDELRNQLENFRSEIVQLKSNFYKFLDNWIDSYLKLKN